MKRLKIWLIEKSDVRNLIIATALIITLVRKFILKINIETSGDFYSPVIFSLLILWVYFNVFYTLNDKINAEKQVIRRHGFDGNILQGKFYILFFLILIGNKSYFIFGKIGAVVSLLIITSTWLFASYLAVKKEWIKDNVFESIWKSAIIVVFITYFFLIPWRGTFCREFGVEEIGNYFEKDNYQTKYMVKINRVDDREIYYLPADITVSKDFSKYEEYDSEGGGGAYSYESIGISENRRAKINKVYFDNGRTLQFESCIIPTSFAGEEPCKDQYGDEWEIEITKDKAR